MPTIDDLRVAMEKAAANMDFEEAGRLGDQISLLRAGGSSARLEDIDPTGLSRQRLGAMSLGTASRKSRRPPIGSPRKSLIF